jgi:hypothetical protein
VEELVPVISGILLGSFLGYLRPARRLRIGAILAILMGILATVVSGEFRLSWGYLLVDIPLVAGVAAVSLILVHQLRWARSRS